MTVFRHVRTGALASVAVLASALTSPVLAQAPKAAARALSVGLDPDEDRSQWH